MVRFAYFGNSQPRPARQEDIFMESNVVIVHDLESAKTFPAWQVSLCQMSNGAFCLFWQFKAKACQAGRYFNRF
jgi:hypothetical protein